MIIVTDSSPLISFALIKRLDLLPKVFKEIYIPKAVYDEIIIWNRPYSTLLKKFAVKENKIKYVKNKPAVNLLRKDLDLGEAEAIALALELNIKNILIDEHKGRKIAASNGLFVVGTIGVLLKAKKEGYIVSVKSLLDELINNKIRISRNLYIKALELAGEK